MWPHRPSNPQQTNPSNLPKPSPYTYHPSLHPPAFTPPPAHHILAIPTPTHPGYSQYSHNPFTRPQPPPGTLKVPTPTPSAFYNPATYPTPPPAADIAKVRAATPRPHLAHPPRFGASGFAEQPHELAFAPFERSQAVLARPFGRGREKAFPGVVFARDSRWDVKRPESGMKGGDKEKVAVLPSEKVRRALEDLDEDGDEQGRKRKRQDSLLPSQKVRKMLSGLGPRDAWDPDSP